MEYKFFDFAGTLLEQKTFIRVSGRVRPIYSSLFITGSNTTGQIKTNPEVQRPAKTKARLFIAQEKDGHLKNYIFDDLPDFNAETPAVVLRRVGAIPGLDRKIKIPFSFGNSGDFTGFT